MVRVAGVEPAWTCSQGMWVAATLHPESWWLVTELNRVHRLFRPALYRRVHEPYLVDGARLCRGPHRAAFARDGAGTRISRVQAMGNPLIRTAQLDEPTRAPNQREQLARAQQLVCG